MTVGENIRQRRKQANMTQKALADACGMADSAIRKYESGKVTPKVETLKRIAAALGVDWLSLYQGDDSQRKNVYEELCKDNGITLEILAQRCDIPLDRLKQYARGKTVPKFRELIRLSQVLRCKWEDLVGNLDEAGGIALRDLPGYEIQLDEEHGEVIATDKRKIRLMDAFYVLNETGKDEAVRRVEEMTEIPRYTTWEIPTDTTPHE